MARLDRAMDAIDSALVVSRRNERTVKDRLARARELVEYIELHYISNYTRDLEDYRHQRRARRASR